ncbi:MAG: hypothetical protein IJ573_06395 [Clostridia bacterium]|nr:hypothetical protein [Clostridia bacterium]
MKWFVYSKAGGTGKSTFAAALAVAAAQQGKRTVLLDASAGSRIADEMLGVSGVDVLDLADALSGETDVSSACYAVPELPDLRYALVSHEDADKLENYAEEIGMLEADCELLIIDTPTEDGGFRRLPFGENDRVFLMARPDARSLNRLSGLCSELEQHAVDVTLVLNDTQGLAKERQACSREEASAMFEKKPLVVIERDASLPKSAYTIRKLMHTRPGKAAAQAVSDLLRP